MSSFAVSLDKKSRVVGYQITKGNFQTTSPNLPQRIAILAEANDANQTGLSTLPVQITSAQQAALLYGDGSPIHMIARILFPFSGGGIGSIPAVVYPQLKAVGATQKLWKILPTGVATANATHTLIVAGRRLLDNQAYNINIVTGDVTTTIIAKIQDAINKVFGCPFKAATDSYEAILTSKWSGLSADGLSVSIDTNNNPAGISYQALAVNAAIGTPSIAGALAQFGDAWNTLVINGYGTDATTMAALMTTNGIPDPTNPTGRYAGIVMKPFVAVTGSTLDDPSSITDALLNDVTIAIAPAPGSLGLHFEAAANMTYLQALKSQNSPQSDVCGSYYPDMPVTTTWSTAAMAQYTNRDTIVKKGCSTVTVEGGLYRVQDFVTTYHPVGENPPQYAYVRNLDLDFNVRYTYYLLEQIYVVDHVISNDGDIVTADNVVKPKSWKAVVSDMAVDLANRGLIASPAFMQASIVVNIGTTNPDRLETFFQYKRTGIARIASTTAQAGFNFGTV